MVEAGREHRGRVAQKSEEQVNLHQHPEALPIPLLDEGVHRAGRGVTIEVVQVEALGVAAGELERLPKELVVKKFDCRTTLHDNVSP